MIIARTVKIDRTRIIEENHMKERPFGTKGQRLNHITGLRQGAYPIEEIEKRLTAMIGKLLSIHHTKETNLRTVDVANVAHVLVIIIPQEVQERTEMRENDEQKEMIIKQGKLRLINQGLSRHQIIQEHAVGVDRRHQETEIVNVNWI
jgi:hypothetical protein